MCIRWFTVGASRDKVQHTRPGQRRVVIRFTMCSEVQRWLVVQVLSPVEPERRLQKRRVYVVVLWRSRMEALERNSVLAEIHRDEDSTVRFLTWNRHQGCRFRFLISGNILYSLEIYLTWSSLESKIWPTFCAVNEKNVQYMISGGNIFCRKWID